jgi:tRNA G18 (ribose-2'-O)-methylase SpoU
MRRKKSYDEIFSTRPSLKQLLKMQRLPMYALIENIRSMHNVGSIFRTSDGIMLSKLFLTGYTATPPRIEIEKTALGATDSVPWEFSANPETVLKKLKKDGVKIYAVEHSTDSLNYSEANYSFPLCVIMGNEVDGVSEKLVQQAHEAIEIPMFGLKQSLNVSVAYGIVMYHILGRYFDSQKR